MAVYSSYLLDRMRKGEKVAGKKLRGIWVYAVSGEPATDAVKTLAMRGMVAINVSGNNAVVELAA